MGLDLITQRNCEVKTEIPQKELLNQIKNRNRAYSVYNMLINDGKTIVESLNTEFTYQLQTLEGLKNETLKVSTLISQTSFLEPLGNKCNNCIVSQNKPFGCIGFVSYPISEQCEIWLASLAESANKKGIPYSTSIIFIKDQKINGNRIKQMRIQGQTFFEANQPKEIILSKSFFKKDTITTDQLFDITFLNGLMQTTHINYLLMLYGGVVSDTSKPNNKPSKLNSENNKYVYLDLDLPNNADKSITEFYNYFHHLFIALINGHDVLMD